MTNTPKTEPLHEWNRLARENAENAIVSSMFESVFKASEPIDTFSTWLLVGTAAVASFMITNAEKAKPSRVRIAYLSGANLPGML